MLRDEVDQGTHTDFTNKEQNVLQVSSYYFDSSATNPKPYFAGVVKCCKVDPKNAGQHSADIRMLRSKKELTPAFFCENGSEKEIDFIHVDGGGDENPSHLEIDLILIFYFCLVSTMATEE